MRRLLTIASALAMLLLGSMAMAQDAPTGATTAELPSQEQLRALSHLLRDPAIQAWLAAQAGAAASPAEAQPEPAGATVPQLAGRVDAMRGFVRELLAAIPRLPAELRQAWGTLSADLENHGLLYVLLLLAMFIGLGFAAQGCYWWATTGFRRTIVQSPLDSVGERLRAVGKRLLFGLGWVLALGVGSIGAFLLFDWPPFLKHVVLAYLAVFLIVMLTRVLARFFLAPGAERFRIVPMPSEAALFWSRWSVVLVGWFFLVRVTLDLLRLLGVSAPALYAFGMSMGLVLLGMALWALWRRPPLAADAARPATGRLADWLLSGYLVLVWLALFTGTPALFYIGIIVLLLPILLRGAYLAVGHVLRPAGGEAEPVPSLLAVILERGLRAALLIGGAYLIAYVLGLDLVALTAQDTLATRLLRGAINAVVILLIADLAWHMLRAWIDRRLAEATGGGEGDADELRRRARMRTLLPIFRNLAWIVLVTMAALMALSAMGIEIGPLIAGAGVVGVAIGFGSQTLVKDIISGMFYLLDDAFRVGEYIVSDKFKGTVESFSLRSVKLRHHRGPLYTVPFGSLGAIQNMSRDWVIDKITMNVTYDTDLDKVKKIIKKVSAELSTDPELAKNIIEPLKMQGVETFGDFAIQIRMKMKTKPGEQFVIRRRAYGMIKKAFAENDIRFAFPTVTVAGGEAGPAAPAIGKQALDMMSPAPAT
jgi:small-conductance mechanosensitive channel